MTCKNCIHYEICNDYSDGNIAEMMKEPCFRLAIKGNFPSREIILCTGCKRNEKNGGDCNRTLPITSRDHVLELNVTEYITLDFCSYGERKTE